MTHREKMLSLGLAAALLVASVATAAAFLNQDAPHASTSVKKQSSVSQSRAYKTSSKNLPWAESQRAQAPQPVRQQQQQQASAQQAASQCNDRNALGYIAGGVAGGLVGNQIGKGSGNTVATIGGALGGAYLGGEHLPLHNALCR